LAKGNHKKGKVQGQSRMHAQLIKMLGVRQLICGVNKMDMVGYKQDKFMEVRDEVKNVLGKVGWKSNKCKDDEPQAFPILPLAGLKGDNIISMKDCDGKCNMPWWKGITTNIKIDGKNLKDIKVETLLDCLENYVQLPPRTSDKVARMPVSGVYKIQGTGDVITGRIEQGVVNVDDKVNFYPSHSKVKCTGVVKSVEMHHKKVKNAGAGDNVGLSIKGLDKANMPKVGDVMCRVADVAKSGHLSPALNFTAKVQILQVPNPIKVGYSPIGFIRTARCAMKITEIKNTVYKIKKAKIVEENPKELKANSSATIVFEPQQMICVDTFKNCSGLARLALMEGNGLVMMGNITEVTKKDIDYGK